MIDDEQTIERIIRDRVHGRSVRAIAHENGVTIKVVNDVLDRYAQSAITQQLRVQSLALELDRLDELQSVFHSKAMEGDTASGALLVKIAERRSCLLGLNAPTQVNAQLVDMTVPNAGGETSTDRLRAAINRIRGIEPPKSN